MKLLEGLSVNFRARLLSNGLRTMETVEVAISSIQDIIGVFKHTFGSRFHRESYRSGRRFGGLGVSQ